MTIDARIGKSIARTQCQDQRMAAEPGDLAILLEFHELPTARYGTVTIERIDHAADVPVFPILGVFVAPDPRRNRRQILGHDGHAAGVVGHRWGIERIACAVESALRRF